MNCKKLNILFLFLFLGGCLFSQEAKNDLDNKSLLDAAQKIAVSLQNPLKILQDSQEIVSKLEKSIENTQAQIDTPEPEKNEESTENIEARIDELQELQKLLQEKQSLRAEMNSQLEKYVVQLEEAIKRARVVVIILQKQSEIFKEIELRITTKSLSIENIPQDIAKDDSKRIESQKEQVEKNIISWEIKKEQIPSRLKQLQTENSQTSKALQEIASAINKYSKQQLVYQKKKQINEELKSKKADELIALLTSLGPKVAEEVKKLNDKVTQIAALRKEISSLEDVVLPDLSNIKIDSQIPSVIAAEKQWKVEQLQIDFQKKSLERKKQYISSVEAIILKIQDFNQEFLLHHEEVLQMESIVEILSSTYEEQVKNLTIAHYEKMISEQTKQYQSYLYFDKQISVWQRKNNEAQQQVKKINSELEELEQKLVQSRKIYDEEKQWEQWIADVDKLDEIELSATLKTYLDDASDRGAKSQELQKTVATLQTIVEEQKQTVNKIQSPIVVYSQQILKDLAKQAERCVEQIALDKQYEVSLRLDRNIDSERLQKSLQKLVQIARGFPREIPGNDIQFLEQQLDFFASVLTIANEKQLAQKKLVQTLEDVRQQQQLQLKEMEKQSLALRKAYGAAMEFQIRLGKKEIKVIPEIVNSVPAKGELVALDELMSSLRVKIKNLEEITLDEQEKQQRFTSYSQHTEQRISILLEKLKYLQKRENLAEDFAQKDFTKTQLQQQQQAIYEKKLDNRIWWVNLLSFFNSVEAEQQEKLLDSYFADLVHLEIKQSNLEKRLLLNKVLVGAVQKERQALFNFKLYSPQQEVLAALAKIEARLKPNSMSEEIKKSFLGEDSKISLPPSLDNEKRKKYVNLAQEEVFRYWLVSLVYEAQKNAIDYEVSKLGLETEIAKYKEDIGRIESKKRQIQPDIEKLTGHSLVSFENLDPIEKPNSREQKNRYLSGEIKYTQQLRADALLHSAIISICNLILIPILAFILIRMLNGVGEKVIHRVTATSYSNQKVREQRVQTLLGILKTTWTAVILIIAGIYMLEQFRIDITPIIASAGVLGLALAFGAQTLVRDYISGFFILLENQYATGDVVEISGVTGNVIKITLRLTIVRSFDGTIHFFPNGTFHQVSNKSKNSRAVIDIGVGYGVPVDKVIDILHQVANDMRRDPHVGAMVLDDYEILGLDSFDDSAITYRMWLKTTPGDQWVVRRATQRRIKIYFDKYDIEIPFPQRVLHNVKEPSCEEQQQLSAEAEQYFADAKTQLAPVQQIQKEQEAIILEKQNPHVEDADDYLDDDLAIEDVKIKTKKKKRKKKKKR